MKDIFEQLHDYGLVPVIKITDKEKAVPLAKALSAGGLNCAEITFRTACAKEAIELVTKALPDMLVGAGTVLTPEQADEACAAGAKFIVSPGFNPRVVKHCIEKGVPVLPGCATPSEVEAAMELGLKESTSFCVRQQERMCCIVPRQRLSVRSGPGQLVDRGFSACRAPGRMHSPRDRSSENRFLPRGTGP